MFKRAVWTSVGYGLGVGSSMYVQRKVKKTVEKTVERYTPEHIRLEATERSKEVVNRVKDFGTGMQDRYEMIQKARTPDFGYDDSVSESRIFDAGMSGDDADVLDLRDEPHRSRRRGRGGFNRHR